MQLLRDSWITVFRIAFHVIIKQHLFLFKKATRITITIYNPVFGISEIDAMSMQFKLYGIE